MAMYFQEITLVIPMTPILMVDDVVPFPVPNIPSRSEPIPSTNMPEKPNVNFK